MPRRSTKQPKSYITTGNRNPKPEPVAVKGEYLPFGYGFCIEHKLIVSADRNGEDCYQCGYERRKNGS